MPAPHYHLQRKITHYDSHYLQSQFFHVHMLTKERYSSIYKQYERC